MNVSIFDMDWFYKKSFIPNVNCMRLSSYHKQKGDNINFISQETHLSLAYDVLYLCRENDDTPMPPRSLIDEARTVLLGHGFRYYGAKEVSAIVTACRPDYLLYELPERNAYANAHFITFYAGGKLITTRQDFHNTKLYHKKTLVTDKYFWKAPDEEIIYCLEMLKDEKNVAFLEPILLSKLIRNAEIREKFLALHFSSGTRFKWKNDYSSLYPKVLDIIDFLKELRSRTKSDLGFIPIRAVTCVHNSVENFDLDALRCFQIISAFKSAKLKCVIIAPKEPLSSAWYDVVSQFETWTRYSMQLSYVEFVVHKYCLQEAATWDIILNNSIKWKDKYIDNLLRWLTNDGWVDHRPLLFLQWGMDELNAQKVDYNKIKQNMNLLYKDIDDE